MMNVTILAHPKSENFERVSVAVRQARLLQGEFVPLLVEAAWLPSDLSKSTNAAILCEKIRERHRSERVVAIVDCQLIPDLLVYEVNGVSVVTTYEWNEKFAPPSLRYHLLYQLASAFLNFAGDLSDGMIDDWAHKDDPAGCVFDWYNDKSELLRTMIAGRVCLDHRGMLAKMSASPAAIAAAELLLQAVRAAAIGQPRDLGASVFIGHGHSDEWIAVLAWMEDDLGLQVEEFNLKPNVGVPNSILLGRMLDQAAAAVMVMTAETKYEDGTRHARENVVHEIGLLQGRLGFERVAILKDEAVTGFSNIDGLTVIPFRPGEFATSPQVQLALRQFLERERLIEPPAPKKKPKRR